MDGRPAKRVRVSGPQSPIVDLLHPNQHPRVRFLLMTLLNTNDVLRLCQTNHAIRNWILSEDWNINTRLKSFMRHPLIFRSLLGSCNAFIKGRFVLEFLGRIPTSGHMGIVVQTGEKAKNMIKYLMEEEGYRPKSEEKGSKVSVHKMINLNPVMHCKEANFVLTSQPASPNIAARMADAEYTCVSTIFPFKTFSSTAKPQRFAPSSRGIKPMHCSPERLLLIWRPFRRRL
jgi:hypothetical protein